MKCLKLLLLFLSIPLFSEDTLLETYLKVFDKQFNPIETALLDFADKTDAFFSGNSNEVKTTGKSHVKVIFSLAKQESSDMLYDVKVKAHLDLPLTKKRLKLIFSSDEEDDYSNSDGQKSILDNLKEKMYLLGLRFSKPSDGPFGYYFQGGVKLNSPIDPYIRFKTSYTSVWFYDWDFTVSQTFSYFYHRQLESKSLLQWRRELIKDWFFTHSNTLLYKDKDELLQSVHALELEYFINSRNFLAFNISANFLDTPHYKYDIDFYETRFGYRYLLTDAFIFEAVPSLIFPKSDDFDASAKIKLNLIYQIGKF